jgi:hypothetical protein
MPCLFRANIGCHYGRRSSTSASPHNSFQNFDYSQAACYFVAICAHEKQCILGKYTRNECAGLDRKGLLDGNPASLRKRRNTRTCDHLHSILVLRDINPSSDDRFFRPAKTKTPTKNEFFAGVL